MSPPAPVVLGSDAPASMDRCAKLLRDGSLVAFPTETVYGLGANALDADAVHDIYRCKGRPLTDPVLCHVPDLSSALELIEWDGGEDSKRSLLASSDSPSREGVQAPGQVPQTVAEVVSLLARSFWPGPLTILCRASARVPPVVTAGTGFVGVRCPSHPVALDLLRRCAVPVAAPSANRFGHVSPTTAAHVVDDLAGWEKGLVVLEGGSCAHGIESTIVRVSTPVPGSGAADSAAAGAVRIEVVRQGAVSIRDILATGVAEGPSVSLEIVQRTTAMDAGCAEQAPGQLITHYSPDVAAFVVREIEGERAGEDGDSSKAPSAPAVADAVVIDFAGALAALRDHALAYENLSESGDAREAAANLFAALRRAEDVDGAKAVLLPDLRGDAHGTEAAVHDRIFRAASGNFAVVRRPLPGVGHVIVPDVE